MAPPIFHQIMASFAAVADAAKQFDQNTFDIANAWSNRQNVANSALANTTNAQNLNVALQANEDAQEFYSKTAGLDALIEQHASQFSGIGQAGQNAQLLGNTNTTVTQQGLAMEQRATQTMMDATTANARNTNAANSKNSENSAILSTAHSVGGMLGTAFSSIYLALKGGDPDVKSITPRDAPDRVDDMTVNQNTAYSSSGMVDPTTAGHAQFIEHEQDSISDSISSALSSSVHTDLPDYSSSSEFNYSWYPNGHSDSSDTTSLSSHFSSLTDSSVQSRASSDFNMTWYPNGVAAQATQPEAVRSMDGPTSLVGNQAPTSEPAQTKTETAPTTDTTTDHSTANDGSETTSNSSEPSVSDTPT